MQCFKCSPLKKNPGRLKPNQMRSQWVLCTSCHQIPNSGLNHRSPTNVREQWLLFLLLSTEKSLEDRHCWGVIKCLLARNVWRIFLRFCLWLWGVWSLRDVTDRDIHFIHSCRKTGWVIGGDLNLPPSSWSHNFTSAGSEIFNCQMIPHLKQAKDSIGLLLLWKSETQSLSLDWNHTQTRNSPVCLEFLVSSTLFFKQKLIYLHVLDIGMASEWSPQEEWKEAPCKGLEWQKKGK